MPIGAATWSFTEDDFGAITMTLQRFLYDAKARCALLVDRSGQLVATVGEPPNFDATAFATLTAATGFKLVKDGGELVNQFGVINPLIGALFAFVSAVLAIKWLITYLERHDLKIFAWYRFAVAGVVVVLLLVGVI